MNAIEFIHLMIKVGNIEYSSEGKIYENKISKAKIPFQIGDCIEFAIEDQIILLKLN